MSRRRNHRAAQPVTVTYADGRREVRAPQSFEKNRHSETPRDLLGQLNRALWRGDDALVASLERRLDYAILGAPWRPGS